jgi:hypothetical protein
MNPVKNIKEIGQQIPDLLLGAQDLPTLLIDSLNGLKINRLGKTSNSVKFSKCVCKCNNNNAVAGCLAAPC